MAKRRKKTTHHRRRSRRMGGVGHKSDLMEIGGLVVGSVAATVIQRQLSSVNAKIVSAAEIVGGIMLKNHVRSPLMQGVALGIAAAGGIGLVHEFGVIHGLEDMVSGLMHPGHYMDEINMPGQRQGGFSNTQHVNSFAGIYNGARVAGDPMSCGDNIPPVGF